MAAAAAAVTVVARTSWSLSSSSSSTRGLRSSRRARAVAYPSPPAAKATAASTRERDAAAAAAARPVAAAAVGSRLVRRGAEEEAFLLNGKGEKQQAAARAGGALQQDAEEQEDAAGPPYRHDQQQNGEAAEYDFVHQVELKGLGRLQRWEGERANGRHSFLRWFPPLWTPGDQVILKLAVPTLLSLAADPLLSLVDTAFVGRLGSTELAALGVDSALFAFAFVVFNFLATATTPLVAQARAAGEIEKCGRVLTQALVLASLMGVGLTFALSIGSQQALMLMGAGDDARLVDVAQQYLHVRALAAPAVLLSTVGQGAFRGMQDTRTPLLITVGANALHLVVVYMLIFGLDTGVAGAAVATCAAEWASAAAYLGMMYKNKDELGLTPHNIKSSLRFDSASAMEFATFLAAGSAMLLRTMVLMGTKTLASAVATHLGTVPIAAHQVAMQLWLFASLMLDSLAIAGQSLVAVELGQGRVREGRAVADRLLFFGGLLGVSISLLYSVSSPWLPSLFTHEPEVIRQVMEILPIVIIMQPLNSVVYVLDGVLVGASDFNFIAVAMVAATAGTASALALVEPLDLGLAGVWSALVVLMLGRAGTLAFRYTARDGPLGPMDGVETLKRLPHSRDDNDC
eukprot:jgi/Chlat1/4550/Chrsp29S04457